jgi:L-methionine (R)-S-oxide reductase
MFAYSKIDETSKESLYEGLAEQARHLIAGEENEIANLANVASLIYMHLDRVNWVGFYLWYESENQLILGPFQGKPACIRIGYGKGVCGTAAKERSSAVVEDVFAFEGHIACDPDSRSEVVVPLVKDGVLIGVLDIDSPETHRFDHEDAKGLSKIVDVLVKGTRFQMR